MSVSVNARKKARGTRYTAVVRRSGLTVSSTFGSERTARTWGNGVERAIDESLLPGGKPFVKEDFVVQAAPKSAEARVRQVVEKFSPDQDPLPRADWTLRRALEHYRDTVTVARPPKSAAGERKRIAQWLAHPLTAYRMNTITAHQIQDHVDARIAAGLAAQTVRNDAHVISALFRHATALPRPGTMDGAAVSGWGLAGLVNPVTAVHLPPQGPGRERRLQDGDDGKPGEEEQIRVALRKLKGGHIAEAALTLGVEMGARMGELLEATVGGLLREGGLRKLRFDKTKYRQMPRTVVLSAAAAEAADALVACLPPGCPPETRLIPWTEHALRGKWRQALAKAKVVDLKFHDLRHEALSRMAAKGLHVGELQKVSGHRTAAILLRYVNARDDEIAAKLDR